MLPSQFQDVVDKTQTLRMVKKEEYDSPDLFYNEYLRS